MACKFVFSDGGDRQTNKAYTFRAKTANISVQGVERNRLKSGACVKIRGGISDVKAAMEAAILAAAPYGKVTAQNVIASPGEGIDVAMEMTINK